MDDLYPLRMRSVYKDYVWGGGAIKDVFKKKTPFKKTAESWEVACHKDGKSVVDNGARAGRTLEELAKTMGESLLGSLCETEQFPLLFKIIDAQSNLSVQVHPDDQYAATHENGERGKTEMWVIFDAKPGAKIAYGFNQEITAEEFKKAISTDRLQELLRFIEVEKGDCFFIDAGRVHAIGEGILIAEIQQNSNATYRVYDWGRMGEDGKPRPLHIEKAIETCNFDYEEDYEKMQALLIEEEGADRSMLVCCRYFAAEHVKVTDIAQEKADGRSFHIIFFTFGSGEIAFGDGKTMEFVKGESYVIPADMGEYTISGKCKYLKSYIPEFENDFLQPLVNAGYTEEEVIALLK